MKTVKAIHTVGKLEVQLTSDKFDGEILDTRVEINGKLVCYIAGSERNNFIEELRALISKYQI